MTGSRAAEAPSKYQGGIHYVAVGLRLRSPPTRQSEGIAMGGPHRFLDKGYNRFHCSKSGPLKRPAWLRTTSRNVKGNWCLLNRVGQWVTRLREIWAGWFHPVASFSRKMSLSAGAARRRLAEKLPCRGSGPCKTPIGKVGTSQYTFVTKKLA